jgi:hypothetical protein
MVSKYSVYSATGFAVPPVVAVNYRPYPRKVSQKERRRKARRLRSNGIKVRAK